MQKSAKDAIHKLLLLLYPPNNIHSTPQSLYVCHTNQNTYQVSDAVGVQTVKDAGLAGGTKSGYPHSYSNKDGILWDVQNCDSNNPLLEYPIFNEGKPSWQKDKKVSEQPATPMRVVFANVGGTAIYCGIMTHVEEDPDTHQGKGYFTRCTYYE